MTTREFLEYIEKNWDDVNPKMINDKETTIKDFLTGDYLPYKSKRPEDSPQFKGGVKANWDRIENIAKKHIDNTNDDYINLITNKLDSAKSSKSLKSIWASYKNTEYRDNPQAEILFEERLKVFKEQDSVNLKYQKDIETKIEVAKTIQELNQIDIDSEYKVASKLQKSLDAQRRFLEIEQKTEERRRIERRGDLIRRYIDRGFTKEQAEDIVGD